MIKKTITYPDYNGINRTEDFYFNLSKAETMEMELGTTGGFAEMVRKIIAAQDMPTLIKLFKEIVLKAYGEKSPDGKYFLKEDRTGRKLCVAFSQTEAYSQLFMELATDAELAAEFINGVISVDKGKQAPIVAPEPMHPTNQLPSSEVNQ